MKRLLILVLPKPICVCLKVSSASDSVDSTLNTYISGKRHTDRIADGQMDGRADEQSDSNIRPRNGRGRGGGS